MIEFRSMTSPTGEDYEKLLNSPDTTKHMPLHSGYMNVEECIRWAEAKSKQWQSIHDLGPWSIYINDEFAGWGGLQPESDNEAGIALVLRKKFWGAGPDLVQKFILKFREHEKDKNIVFMLASTRKPMLIAKRYGLKSLGQVEEQEKIFYKFLVNS